MMDEEIMPYNLDCEIILDAISLRSPLILGIQQELDDLTQLLRFPSNY